MPEDVACPDPVASPPVAPSTDGVGEPAVDAILARFERFEAVAIGERHGWRAEHELFASLVCDPRFPGVVDSIVIEFGNRRLQPVLDRYLAGEPVTLDELAAVWRESTQRSGVWEDPVYRRFLGLVRTVNASLPADDRIRVHAGDPPIDWAAITRTADCPTDDAACLDHWIHGRDESMAEVVLEAMVRGERTLLIAGSGHVERRLEPGVPPSVPQLVEAERPGAVFAIVPGTGFGDLAGRADMRLDDWPLPGLGEVRGTWLERLDACLLEGPLPPDAGPCPDDGPGLADVADGYLLVERP